MTQPKSRLGRGLGDLIASGAATAAPVSKGHKGPEKIAAHNDLELVEIELTQIAANRYQPRREFREETIVELAESIRSQGLVQPIVVRKSGKKFELIAGERRLRAFKHLARETITARVIQASDASSATLALIENLQREGLNPIEEALGFSSLIRDFDLTQEMAAEKVGKARATVANALRLLTLEDKIQGYLAKGMLSTGHAKVLLGLTEPEHRDMLAQRIIAHGLSVRDTEHEVERLRTASATKTPAAAPKRTQESRAIASLEKRLSSQLKTQVALKHSAKKGKLIIDYYGNDDLQRLLEQLGLAAE